MDNYVVSWQQMQSLNLKFYLISQEKRWRTLTSKMIKEPSPRPIPVRPSLLVGNTILLPEVSISVAHFQKLLNVLQVRQRAEPFGQP